MLSNDFFFTSPHSPQNSHANKTFMWSIPVFEGVGVCLHMWS